MGLVAGDGEVAVAVDFVDGPAVPVFDECVVAGGEFAVVFAGADEVAFAGGVVVGELDGAAVVDGAGVDEAGAGVVGGGGGLVVGVADDDGVVAVEGVVVPVVDELCDELFEVAVVESSVFGVGGDGVGRNPGDG